MSVFCLFISTGSGQETRRILQARVAKGIADQLQTTLYTSQESTETLLTERLKLQAAQLNCPLWPEFPAALRKPAGSRWLSMGWLLQRKSHAAAYTKKKGEMHSVQVLALLTSGFNFVFPQQLICCVAWWDVNKFHSCHSENINISLQAGPACSYWGYSRPQVCQDLVKLQFLMF